MNQFAVINRYIPIGSIESLMDSAWRRSQSNHGAALIAHSLFQTTLGNRVKIRLWAKAHEADQTVKLITDNVIKMRVEVRVAL